MLLLNIDLPGVEHYMIYVVINRVINTC